MADGYGISATLDFFERNKNNLYPHLGTKG
jgi:hypothetical protein